MKSVYLTLADGQVFEGKAFGAPCTSPVIGELVFTTNMVGYIETLTDPSYYGQIVMQTFPLIGNYGMISSDMESEKSHVRGYVVTEWCEDPSNFRCEETLDAFLKKQNIVGICGVNTREITRIIREEGVMNAVISSLPATEKDLSAAKAYLVTDALKNTSRFSPAVYSAAHEGINRKSYKISLLDCGAKQNIVRELQKRGCEVTVYPYTASCEEILMGDPDGIMLSNGPGDPAENTDVIGMLKTLLGKKPIFGICLGHQLLALAAGAKTVKLKYGHRGANHPVKDLRTGRTYITSQNHGYAVDPDTVEGRWRRDQPY